MSAAESAPVAGLVRPLVARTTPDLYAVIKRSSNYYYQQPLTRSTFDGRPAGAPVPFLVTFVDDCSYPVRGNANNYRVGDLHFFVRVGARFVSLV